MKIRFIHSARPISIGQIDPVIRAEKELRDYGYELSNKDYDLLFVQTDIDEDALDLILKEAQSPVILINGAASTGTAKFKFYLKYENKVIGYIKKSLLKNRELYLKEYPRSRYHFYLISKSHTNYGLDDKVEDTTIFKKEWIPFMFTGWNVGVMNRKGIEDKNNKIVNKKIDIHANLGLKNKEVIESTDHYTVHRRECVKKLNSLSKRIKIEIGKVNHDKYIQNMFKSKICISPWGLGEVCFRDFEAVNNGTILIKPDMSHVDTWPNVYIPNVTYIPCKVDFSDLKDIVDEVLINYSKYKYIATNAYMEFEKSWNNRIFANRFNEIINGIRKWKK